MTGQRLYFIRHGRTVGAGALIGHADPAPLESGTAACMEKSVGLYLDAVISSDLMRACLAAERIAAWHGVAVRSDPDWRELHFGEWEGQSPADLDDAALARFWADPDADPPPGGERWSALCDRVTRALGRVGPDTLIVAHAGSIRAALCRLCGFGYAQSWAIDLPYGVLVTLEVHRFEPGGARILALQP
ncbi:histidine phosphatase family protein [uncultured Croceicoccus sp.]|uniref:histidine phosphatase family protein n=1 Tax=uncultured Croceicoccus sp. TaxID=1295329 RepID=UPI0026329704|nr:histidine phosphatase family protein [uncultured Croceicoccus sp.]